MEKENGSCPLCAMKGNNHWVHIVIRIAVALIVFWAGVQFGELKATLHGGYGYRMMGSYGSQNQGFYGPNMMYRNVQGVVSQPVSASVTATTTKK